MIDLEKCTFLGTLAKGHGTKGQIVLRLNHTEFGEINNKEPVFVIIDGLPVPFFINTCYRKDLQSYILELADITNEKQAGELVNCDLYISKTPKKNNTKKFPAGKSLLGYEVVNKMQENIGIIEKILDYNQNPLFQVSFNKKEILIPAHPDLILNTDHKKKIVVIDIPDGLTDIF